LWRLWLLALEEARRVGEAGGDETSDDETIDKGEEDEEDG